MDIDERQSAVGDAIAETSDDIWNNVPDGSFLNGWVMVAEWIAPDGTKHLSRLFSDDTTEWQRHGMHAMALDDQWWEEDE